MCWELSHRFLLNIHEDKSFVACAILRNEANAKEWTTADRDHGDAVRAV